MWCTVKSHKSLSLNICMRFFRFINNYFKHPHYFSIKLTKIDLRNETGSISCCKVTIVNRVRRESSESVEEFTSTNFNSQNVIASLHIPSGEICAKLTSCLSLHHFSIIKIFRSYRRGKIPGKTERERECE